MSEDEARRRVAAERQRRGYFSVRAAAAAAEKAGVRISNTTWSDWESGKRPVGDAVRGAVMVLFDWPADWVENPPDSSALATTPAPPPGGWVSLERHVRLQDQVDSLAARVQELGAEVERLRKRADRVEQ